MRLSRLLPLCLALSGCALEPDDPIYLSGTALEADGSPWHSGPLTLMRPRKVDVHVNEYNQELYATRFEPWAEVTTDADGLFLHRVNARDVGADFVTRPSPWTSDTLFQLHLPRADGGRDFLSFDFASDVDLPPLRPWDSSVHTVDEAGGVRLSWEPMSPTADIPEPQYFVLLRGEDGPAWQVHVGEGEPWLRPEMLEDFTREARVQAVARGSRIWFRTSLYYDAVSESPPVPLSLAPGVPASRGAACSLKSRAFTTCPFTDGKLALTQVGIGDDVLPKELFLTLKEPVRPRRLILRGLEAFGDVLHVEGSVDGKTWLPLGNGPLLPHGFSHPPYADDPAELSDQEQYVDVTLSAEAPVVSRIRLFMDSRYTDGSSGPGQFSRLREVSLFGASGID
ncbi:hypothetical protein JY651_42200 [Pyxidicoccus parkwayensis]|uniref:Lipoprotein n=1 Tax=Pyxidicoccus parkwayensis TaxID=2813578 RepID=A0ABX7NS37_9BACT|nr:hypothetical protein [Pyxidicoccus parkwaysis]QSQ21705.1 hypothetical protein JY651_42200 [Pyxidicoccus parkwaysis]